MKNENKVEDINTMVNKDIKNDRTIDNKKNTSNVKVKKFKDLEGKFLLVKVGTSDKPATDSQINDIKEDLLSLLEKNNINCVAFVTHHAVSMEIIENKMEIINNKK